jgi:dTMP kinase
MPVTSTSTRNPWLSRLAGRFIVFDGPDGSGKSTQLRNFARALADHDVPTHQVRDPGGTPVGERIRELLLNRGEIAMSARCETLLFMASRAELVETEILPALSRGQLVLADRFVSSTLAYQGTAGGVPWADIAAAARVATRGLIPDLIVIFDLDEQAAAKRLSPLLDRMEAKGLAFHRAVRKGYLDQAATDPGRYIVVDAGGSPEDVWRGLLAAMAERVDHLGPTRGGSPRA